MIHQHHVGRRARRRLRHQVLRISMFAPISWDYSAIETRILSGLRIPPLDTSRNAYGTDRRRWTSERPYIASGSNYLEQMMRAEEAHRLYRERLLADLESQGLELLTTGEVVRKDGTPTGLLILEG